MLPATAPCMLRRRVTDTGTSGPAAAAPLAELVLVLRIAAGEPPAGSIQAAGEHALPFTGWVGMLTAIGAARAMRRDGPGGCPAAADGT